MPTRARSVHSIDAPTPTPTPAGAQADRLKEVLLQEYGGPASRAAGALLWTRVRKDALGELMGRHPVATWAYCSLVADGDLEGFTADQLSTQWAKLLKDNYPGAKAADAERQRVSAWSPSPLQAPTF